MVTKDQILILLKGRLNKVLLVAESCLPEPQFRAFRKIALDEFGRSGLEGELERLERESEQTERNGPGRN
ncbi:MAG: hypothetical protein EPO61_05290 [Nitrospirae bacterium]|nr:MAG: hypothetical protein EPO61_05290 [Nitrospirota bacterium]